MAFFIADMGLILREDCFEDFKDVAKCLLKELLLFLWALIF